MPVAAALPAIIGAGASIGGSLLQGRSNNNANQIPLGAVGPLLQNQQWAAGQANAQDSQLWNQIQALLGGETGYLSQFGNQLIPQIGQDRNLIANLFGSSTLTDTPEGQAALERLMTSGQQIPQHGYDVVQGILGNRGQTQDTRQGVDRAMDILLGRGSAMGTLSDVGQEIVGNRGRNENLARVTDAGSNLLKNEDPRVSAALDQALSLLSGGGSTATTQGLQNRGMDLFNRESVLPMGKAASMAADRASGQVANEAKAARAQALARGAGPGAITSGSQNAGMADFSDKGMRFVADTVQKAILDQQGLGLQQNAMGADNAVKGAELERLTQQMGLQSTPQLIDSILNAQGLGGNMLLGAERQVGANLGTGADLLNSYNQTRLQGGNLLGSLLGLEQQGLGQGLNALNNLTGTEAGINQALAQAIMGGRNGGVNLGNLMSENYQRNTNNLGNALSSGQGSFNDILNMLGQGRNSWLGYATGQSDAATRLTGQAGAQASNQGSPWAQLLLGGAPGLLATAIGGYSNKGNYQNNGSGQDAWDWEE
jgi:hypothetical protein